MYHNNVYLPVTCIFCLIIKSYFIFKNVKLFCFYEIMTNNHRMSINRAKEAIFKIDRQRKKENSYKITPRLGLFCPVDNIYIYINVADN